MSTIDSRIALNAQSIAQLIKDMQPEARKLFQDVLADVRDRGSAMSDATINELAKKYADKARKLAGAGGDS